MRGSTELPPARSALVARFMARFFAHYMRRHLNGLSLAAWGIPDARDYRGPLVVYCNHPSWWDAATLAVLADRYFPERESYAPFDAAMLARYAVFRKLGAFPVEADSRRGTRQFLTVSRWVLDQPTRMLWITAQGRFADTRARPLGLAPGVAHLIDEAPHVTFLPLALDYTFWNERGPECFCAFGQPIEAADLRSENRPGRLARLEQALEATLDRLSTDVIAREPSRFVPVLSGAKGIGGLYGYWERLRAALQGRSFAPGHDPTHRIDQPTPRSNKPT